MKNMYIKPEVEMTKFEVASVVTLNIANPVSTDSSNTVSSRRAVDDGTGTRVRQS